MIFERFAGTLRGGSGAAGAAGAVAILGRPWSVGGVRVGPCRTDAGWPGVRYPDGPIGAVRSMAGIPLGSASSLMCL